ncbi:hypothetical protein NW759_001780 [Fusarium solani]|nr:hypothetical protein NW759_001780 [Fusarium solani]
MEETNESQHGTGDEHAAPSQSSWTTLWPDPAGSPGPSPPLDPNDRSLPPKIGARFTLQTVKILRDWFGSHIQAPYPSEEEKMQLQQRTGLNQTQIENWLANARRRHKIQAAKSARPQSSGPRSVPIDIPRASTPCVSDGSSAQMNPMQRWVDSPPEDEAASLTAIARALSLESRPGQHDVLYLNKIPGQSSASSAGASTNDSSTSASSHISGSSGSSLRVTSRGRRRRKKGYLGRNRLPAPLKTFQCTFCTETFARRYDWQRHEKTYHLSLERWVCTPDGCRVLEPESNQICCVFCGETDPDDDHIRHHNYSICEAKTLGERTFYRKDHLVQHLRLVHDAEYLGWCMSHWKSECSSIKSRCGLCGMVMDSWHTRQDHLAEHFRMGETMAGWKGDWGLEDAVLRLVQNSMPPYLISEERNSPFPFSATAPPIESPPSAYELIKLEVSYFIINYQDKNGCQPTDVQSQLEACRVIFASEVSSDEGATPPQSWLRDLIMSSETIAQQARYGPLRSPSENRLATLKINGKDHLFQHCPMEQLLQGYISTTGLDATDEDLQSEACRIILDAERASTTPCNVFANWLLRQARSSTDWLCSFRQRTFSTRNRYTTNIATGEHLIDELKMDPNAIEGDSGTVGGNSGAAHMQDLHEDGIGGSRPAHAQGDLVEQIEMSLPWSPNLSCRQQIHPAELWLPSDVTGSNVSRDLLDQPTYPNGQSPKFSFAPQAPAMQSDERNHPALFLSNDTNSYNRLARELGRFVKSTTSPNNPFQHVPTDEELQHQARCILYDDDDPWNQTAADNPEWLLRFKLDVGLI